MYFIETFPFKTMVYTVRFFLATFKPWLISSVLLTCNAAFKHTVVLDHQHFLVFFDDETVERAYCQCRKVDLFRLFKYRCVVMF